MFGRTQILQALPEVVSLEDGPRLRLRMLGNPIQGFVRQGLLAPGDFILLTKAVDEAIARGFDEEDAELVDTGKLPAGVAKALENIAPGGLDNVGRIKLGAEVEGEQSPHHFSQVRLELKEDFFSGHRIAAAQLVQQCFQGRLVHGCGPVEKCFNPEDFPSAASNNSIATSA